MMRDDSTSPLRAPMPPVLGRDSYVGHPNPVTFELCGGGPSLGTLFWLGGSGQRPDNELIRRFCNALHAEGVTLTVHALHHERGLRELPTRIEQTPGAVWLGGHSAGGGAAATLIERVRVRGLVLINPCPPGQRARVRSLTIFGENDGGGRFACDNDALVHASCCSPPGGADAVTLIARQGDHSIRYNPDDGDKDAHSASEKTRQMNLAVAKEVAAFLGASR